MHGQNHII